MLNPQAAEIKNKHLNRCLRTWSLAEPELTAATVAVLSDLNSTLLPCQLQPHTAAAIKMGTSSFAAIFLWAQSVGHSSWNQGVALSNRTAPQPQLPEASV